MIIDVFCFSIFCCVCSIATGSKILGIFPLPAKNHFAARNPVMIELAKRGHQVTVYTPFVKYVPIPNYTQIDLKEYFKVKRQSITMDLMASFKGSIGNLILLFNHLPKLKDISSCKPLMDLLSDYAEKFHLLVTETFHTEDIEKFINESEHGVVYFCMGSLLRGSSFPEEKRDAFLYAFSKIPQRVLWKWEGDDLPGKSDKIMISKWMPQRDILAHPKVKLFISHGGLLGTSEAVYEGVPIIGIPIFGDQKTNVRAIESTGAGEMLDYNDITKEVVYEKVNRILTDPKFKENAKELSRRYRDRPMSPLDTAVYWTEYVIRHKGAPHLRSAAVDMPWYQYLLLDVVAFILAVSILSLLIVYYAIKFTLRFLSNLIFGKPKLVIESNGEKKRK